MRYHERLRFNWLNEDMKSQKSEVLTYPKQINKGVNREIPQMMWIRLYRIFHSHKVMRKSILLMNSCWGWAEWAKTFEMLLTMVWRDTWNKITAKKKEVYSIEKGKFYYLEFASSLNVETNWMNK